MTPVASLGRTGLTDFIVQRASAVVLAAYACCVVGWFASGTVDQPRLAAFFGALGMRAFTTLAVLALAAHAWIGMWIVATDYIREHHVGRLHAPLRGAFLAACLVLVFVYVVWPLAVVWDWR